MQVLACQAGSGPNHSLRYLSAFGDDAKPTKIDYEDVRALWVQKIEESDPRRKQSEFEMLKNRLREALSPETLIALLQKLEEDPTRGITLFSTKCESRMCEEVCEAIKAEGLPDWLSLITAQGTFFIFTRE